MEEALLAKRWFWFAAAFAAVLALQFVLWLFHHTDTGWLDALGILALAGLLYSAVQNWRPRYGRAEGKQKG